MEDHGNSRAQENQDYIRVAKNQLFVELFDNQKFIVPNRENNYSFLSSYFAKLATSKADDDIQLSKILKSINKNQTSISKSINKLGKDNNESDRPSLKELIGHISHQVLTLSDLPKCLTELPYLGDFDFCQILLHQKGTVNVASYYYGPEAKTEVSLFPISKFNKLFLNSRKSKSKIFNASNYLNSALNTTGTFLAKPLELKLHNVVFILSRGSFIPPSDTESELFQQVLSSIKSYLEQLVENEQRERQIYYQYLCLKILPYGITLDDSTGEIFSNDYRLSHQYEDGHTEKILTNNTSMKIYKKESHDLITDFNHYERIHLLGNLLNTLSHELSNPLFGMKLTCDILRGETNDSDSKEILGDIITNLERSQSILQNFSQLYNDKLQSVNIVDIIKETLKIAKSEIRNIKREINFYNNEDANITSNPTWISQILFNLIINSIQAMRDNFIRTEAQRIIIELKEEDDEYSIFIGDSGPGIPQELKERIFKPFFTTKKDGTGLGLSICHNLSRRLNGNLEYIDKFYAGACFKLSLPKNHESTFN